MSRSTQLIIVLVALFGAACEGEGAGSDPRRHVVEIRGFEYHPEPLTVVPGDTILWTNRDAVPHTATSVQGVWDSGSSGRGVVEPNRRPGHGGTYTCTLHRSMTGRITVQ